MTAVRLHFSAPPHAFAATATVIPVFRDVEHNGALHGDLALEAARAQFQGDIGDRVFVASGPGTYNVAIGAGPSTAPSGLRRFAFHAVDTARTLRSETLVLQLDASVSADNARACVEGALLSCYHFDHYKKPKNTEQQAPTLRDIYVVADDALRPALEQGQILANAVNFARDLANEHPGRCTPAWLALEGKARADLLGLDVTVFDEDQLEEKGFGLHLAVARGSDEPARLLHAIYRPEGAIQKKVALVGKGVTFDSGGYSIKPASSMLDMHLDMGGAAAVLGAMDAIGRLKPAGIEVHFIVPMAENMVSGGAYKINEIVRGYNGTTVEIHNTDAEGRLLLADALAYAVEQGVDEVIDLATLTGACVVALGAETAGVFASKDALRDGIVRAAGAIDELVWPLPLVDRMESQLSSRIADLKNIGSRWGGAISAAMFLKHFVGETPWAHIDLAGPAMAESPWEYICAGGTGFGVLTLAEYVRQSSTADA